MNAIYSEPDRQAIEQSVISTWSELLHMPAAAIGPTDGFFALGGESILIAEVMERLNARFFSEASNLALSLTELFRYTTPRALAERIMQTPRPLGLSRDVAEAGMSAVNDASVAIIGMSVRATGATTLDGFWRNIRSGVESIESFTNVQLQKAGISADLLGDARYVPRGGRLEGVELFDADYFGMSGAEADITCPQQRILMECAEEALHHAGYGVRGPGIRVGVYMGGGRSEYVTGLLGGVSDAANSIEQMSILIANTSPATRIAYYLDLNGPSMGIDTACSSSLVAVHQACLALRCSDCDVALAGGATVNQWSPRGYRYEPGGIVSPDGHCRAFDEAAEGTIFTDGAGVVLLKRLSDARRDGDTVHAIIRGYAINNDGRAKTGYTAPSVEGQVRVISAALKSAGIKAADVQYVETHGTATSLGDSIELMALTEVFGGVAQNGERCALGALKGNIGHTEAAAGVLGLIKATFAAREREMPPTILHSRPNPNVPWEQSPFFVNTELRPWAARRGRRCFSVSAFGIGGTNAHLVLEEGIRHPPGFSHRSTQLLVISGRSAADCLASRHALARSLDDLPIGGLADLAYTLQVGAKVGPWRSYFACANELEALEVLRSEGAVPHGLIPRLIGPPRAIVVAFPAANLGAVRMARVFNREEPTYRAAFRRCADFLCQSGQWDLQAFIAGNPGQDEPGSRLHEAHRTEQIELTTFAHSYAFSCLLEEWGLRPSRVLGYGVGQCVAAFVAGFLDWHDAARIVIMHARVRQHLRDGQSREEAYGRAAALARASLAISQTEARGTACDYLCGRTGFSLSREIAGNAEHWIAALSCASEAASIFYARLKGQMRDEKAIFIEAGPVTNSMPADAEDAEVRVLESIGDVWAGGAAINWQGFNKHNRCHRVALPAPVFARTRHWRQASGARPTAECPAPRLPTSSSEKPFAQSGTRSALAAMWKALLGVERVQGEDDFFDLGGDSLLAMHLSAVIERQWGSPLPLKQLMAHSTLDSLAAALDLRD